MSLPLACLVIRVFLQISHTLVPPTMSQSTQTLLSTAVSASPDGISNEEEGEVMGTWTVPADLLRWIDTHTSLKLNLSPKSFSFIPYILAYVTYRINSPQPPCT